MSLLRTWTAAVAAVGPLLAQDFGKDRENMVHDQIESRGVKNPAVLRAMRAVPRHLFVGKEFQREAYGDHPLPIGQDQTISQPYIVALMTEWLDVKAGAKILEIGTGSGYQAAVLAELKARVYSIELLEKLATQARDRLRNLGHTNVVVRHGDGYKGWPEEAPFDRIILTAAPPEIPKALTGQLKPGGRMVAPVGQRYQELMVIEKDSSGRVTERSVLAVRFVPMVPSRQ